MSKISEIDELDFLALADGQLEEDPARKAEVEAVIARSPSATARLLDYQAQTAALQAAYCGARAEQTPERLKMALTEKRAPLGRAVAGIAAALLVTVAGIGGWLIGRDDQGDAGRALLEQSYQQFTFRPPEDVIASPGGQTSRARMAGGSRPFGALPGELALRLRAPDLSASDFALVDKQALPGSRNQVVRLDYVATDGRAFSLFIAPRRENRRVRITEEARDDVSLAYWLDGPLTYSIATRLPKREARLLAETVRHSMHDETTPPSTILQPEFRSSGGLGQEVRADPTDGALSELELGMQPQNGAANLSEAN